MTQYSDPAHRKVRYTAAIIYLLLMGFVLGGSIIHQQDSFDEVQQQAADEFAN